MTAVSTAPAQTMSAADCRKTGTRVFIYLPLVSSTQYIAFSSDATTTFATRVHKVVRVEKVKEFAS